MVDVIRNNETCPAEIPKGKLIVIKEKILYVGIN